MIPAARYAEIPAVAHGAPVLSPELVAAVMAEFLGCLAAQQPAPTAAAD